jgi:hypothetical protein
MKEPNRAESVLKIFTDPSFKHAYDIPLSNQERHLLYALSELHKEAHETYGKKITQETVNNQRALIGAIDQKLTDILVPKLAKKLQPNVRKFIFSDGNAGVWANPPVTDGVELLFENETIPPDNYMFLKSGEVTSLKFVPEEYNEILRKEL